MNVLWYCIDILGGFKMVKLTEKPLKIMKMVHVICSQIWFGTVWCIFIYALYCFNNNFEKNTAIKFIEIIPFLYQRAIMPFALVCVIQGIIYGIFTQYGFIKYKWIIAKWVLTIFVIICTGIGGIGQIFSIIGKINYGEINVLTMNDGKLFFVFIIGQIIFLSTMTIISIIKPKNKKT
jgi:hypothetical protein